MKKAGKEIPGSPRQASALPWSRRQRLRYLEALAYWKGSFRRADLLDRFDIGIQRVSDDIQEYLRRNPEALVYDRNEKLYRAAREDADLKVADEDFSAVFERIHKESTSEFSNSRKSSK